MSTQYKQSFIMVMEDGKFILWTGKADDTKHGEGLAIAYAVERTGSQVWDIANRPVK